MHTLPGLRLRIAALALVAASAAACSTTSDNIVAVDAEGTVYVFLFRDDNLNATYNTGVDLVLEGTNVDLRLNRTLSIRRGGITDSAGVRVFHVAVGRYSVAVDSMVLADSLEIEAGGVDFTVASGDSLPVPVALKYKTITISEARALQPGKAAWVRGIVMNSPGAFGDSTVHIVDDSAAVRTTKVRPGLPLLPGDSVLFLGRRTTRDGQPVIELLVTPIVQGVISPPPPDSIGTGKATTADGGALDARYVKVAGATVSDTATVNNTLRLTVNDGSGSLDVVLSPNVNFGNLNQYAPGARLDIGGLLAPDPLSTGIWVLRPRARQDITVLN